jgi:hypothetical protein
MEKNKEEINKIVQREKSKHNKLLIIAESEDPKYDDVIEVSDHMYFFEEEYIRDINTGKGIHFSYEISFYLNGKLIFNNRGNY